MNLVDVLTEEGFNGTPADYSTSNSTNVYERVAAESNPDYAPMLASISKHMDNDLNRKRALFGVLNSIKQRRDAITDATTKFNREVSLERIKSLLDMKEKLLELRTKKRLGLGSGLTYQQKLDLEKTKHDYKVKQIEKMTEELEKRLGAKEESNIRVDNVKTGNKKVLKTHNIDEDLRKQEKVQADKIEFQGIKHGNSMEQIDQKHKNNVEFQGIKHEDAIDLEDLKHTNSLENLLTKSDFNSLNNQERFENNKKLIKLREESAIRRDDNNFKNKESLEDKRHKNKTDYETQTSTNKENLLTTRLKGQKDAKQIDKEIQEGKNSTNLKIQESREKGKNIDKDIQDKKLEAAKLGASTDTNEGYTPPVNLIKGPKPNNDTNNSGERGGLFSKLFSSKYGFNPIITDEDLLSELGIIDEEFV